jgi:DNA-binding response OmpR family regulator
MAERVEVGRILVAEDDPTISALIAYGLRREGYQVVQETDGRRAAELALEDDVDLVLLDRMMPGMDGLEAARMIKKHRPELPLIMVTALSGGRAELAGFEAGADDYVTKPFDMDELLARLRARLTSGHWNDCCEEPDGSASGLVFDSDRRTVRAKTQEAHLRPIEYRILSLLASEPGRLNRREEITERVWKHRYLADSRTLDTHIASLRRHLKTIGADATIKTVRGIGYRLEFKLTRE